MFKKIVFSLLVACMYCFSLNASTFVQPNLSGNAVYADLHGDPADKLIERFEKWITLTQGQKDDIIALADTYTWTNLTNAQLKQTSKDFRAEVYNDILTNEQKIALKAK